MNDRPRRRRSDDDSERGSGLPLFPLVLIVIFAGLLLGGALAHFFGGSKGAPSPAPLALATPAPSPAVTLRPLAAPSPRSTATPSPKVSPANTPTPRASHSPATATPAATRSPAATHSPAATPAASAPPATAKPPSSPPKTPASQKAIVATVAPNYVQPGAAQAEGIVRSYLGALARGDRATATSYLARGLPGEVFMDQSARIVSVRATSEGAPYRVLADVRTAGGEYDLTFTLEPGQGGLQITDHYAIKVH